MKPSHILLVMCSVGMLLVSGCSWPILEKTPFLSRLYTQKPQPTVPVAATPKQILEPKPAITPAPAPVFIPPPPPEQKKTVAPSEALPASAVVRPAASVVEPPAPRNRLVDLSIPDLSYDNAILTEDTVWRGRISVTEGVTVAPQATLTIEPGTIVRFREHGVLFMQGRVVAKGTPEQPILFTSAFVEPEPGDWQGILLLGSEKNNLFEQCGIEGADTGIAAMFSRLVLDTCSPRLCRVGASFDDSLVTIRNGVFRKNGIGIRVVESELEIVDADISGNRQGIVATASSMLVERNSLLGNEAAALVLEKGRAGIRGNRLSGNGTGAVFTRMEATISANSIVSNSGVAVSAEESRLRLNANDISSNGGIGLRVNEGRVVAWGNVIADNGQFETYNGGQGEVTVIGNWWGGLDKDELARRIHGRHRDRTTGPVRFLPVLRLRPAVGP